MNYLERQEYLKRRAKFIRSLNDLAILDSAKFIPDNINAFRTEIRRTYKDSGKAFSVTKFEDTYEVTRTI